MKNIFILIACLWISTILGQEDVLRFNNLDFVKSIRNVENYSLSDGATGNLAIILGQKRNIKGYLYDSNFQKIGEASGDHLKRKYQETIGYSVVDTNVYTLLFTTNSKKKFGYVSLNLQSGEVETNEIPFKFDGEKYLETINYDNRIIMMSATKKNALTLREFTSNFTFKTIATFQLDRENGDQQLIESYNFEDFDFYKTLKGSIGGITKIDTRVPNIIERSSDSNKLYHQGDKVHITFEEDEKGTILNTIDLSNLSLTTSFLEYPEGRISDFKNFNSFIYGAHIFHIASSRDEMLFQIKDFKNEVLKEYHAVQNSEIPFKNSPIMQEGSAFGSGKRELNKTKQFLRKITSGSLGVSIHREDNSYQVTLGSHAVMGSGGGGFAGVPMGPVGGTTIPVGGGNTLYVPAYNPTFSSYGSYGASKAVYINALFDMDFNHIKYKEFQDNIFDRVKAYQQDLEWDTAEDIFIHNDKTYFSFWNTREREYHLLEF